ncbi:hypothetical protein ETB97_011371 [Aspergillus alliaceus]|uniref:Uncharacterized protein n=1 Tax=Petromyces alliaceus TaxID=209559 RepID=A0A8H6A9H2_PETAA|nr:hypothetical protein ETB97_011371 [Aspergillus burnettii]
MQLHHRHKNVVGCIRNIALNMQTPWPEGFEANAEEVELSDFSDEEIDSEFDRKSEEAREDMNNHIDKSTRWPEAFTKNVLRLEGEEQRQTL